MRNFLKKHNLIWAKLPVWFDEAPFWGNGLMGGMIFRQHDSIRMEVGQSDVQDHRSKEEAEVAFSQARLPIGFFKITPDSVITGGEMELDLYTAQCYSQIHTEQGGFKIKNWIHAEYDVGVCEIEDVKGHLNIEFVHEAAVSPRQTWGMVKKEPKRICKNYRFNPNPVMLEKDGCCFCIQELLCGWETVTAYRIEQQDGKTEIYYTVSHCRKGEGIERAQKVLEKFLSRKEEFYRTHKEAWKKYFEKTFVSLPDGKMEGFYWIQLYKLRCALRENGVVIDNQGPWLWDTAWPYATWNLNVQLTYLPMCTANRAEMGVSLLDHLYSHLQQLIDNCPEDFRADSAAIGTAATQECDANVADLRVTNGGEIANLVWAMHNCWMFYRYRPEAVDLRKLHEILRRAVNYILHYTYEKDGKLHIYNSGSPEYGNAKDCNYTLSLLRWGLLTLSEIESTDKKMQGDKVWKDILEKLTDFPENEKEGYMIGRDQPYEKSHRHYSHLLMIYPLGLITPDTEENRNKIIKSIEHWQSLGDLLRGYSFTGAASMYALLGMGNEALVYLNKLWEDFLRPNTFYVESGPCIETPLAAMQALNEMLLQSRPGEIKVFPAVPDEWQDVVFRDLLADGGVEVTAVRRNGRNTYCRLKAGRDVCFRLMLKDIDVHNALGTEQNNGDFYQVKMSQGEVIELGDVNEAVEEVCRDTKLYHCYGLNALTGGVVNVEKRNFELL